MIKQIAFFLLTLGGLSPAFAHDLQLGIFEIYQTDNILKLDIRLDKEDLITVIQNRYSYLSLETDSIGFQSCIEEYIQQNLSMSVNNQNTHLTFYFFEYEKDIIAIQAVIFPSIEKVENILLTNTIFIDEVDKQTNIIKLSLRDRERSFRLHKDRPSTTIEYE